MAKPIDVHKVFAEYFKGCEALAYAVSSRLGEGNICIDIKEYVSNTDLTTENPFFTDADSFMRQIEEGDFVTHTTDDSALKPFILYDRKVYLQRYFKYESDIIKNVRRLGDRFQIVTGGPGSGKTYSVSRKLVELFSENINLKVALAAPTGKAAVRMNESIKKFAGNPDNKIDGRISVHLTNLSAQTIHRLLGTKSDSVFFKYDETNRLPYDVVIIDECSMIDGALMAKLLNAVDDKTKLYLIGDKDQLASVEAGSVFGDMCRASDSELLRNKVEIIFGSRRFKEDEGIWQISQKIINGEQLDTEYFNDNEQVTIDHDFSQELFENYAQLFSKYILEENIREALNNLNLVRFLCVTRENDKSVSEYNKKIQNFLFRNVAGFKPKSDGFYHNQPIIVTRNDYKLNLFNGDVGLVREKEAKDGRKVLMAFFENTDGTIREIQAGYLNYWETVFAMTIHKSQGSEFENVVVVLPDKQGENLLTRELLYTGVTRAIKKVLIQGKSEVLLRCLSKRVIRASGLEKRINNEKMD